jgi:hypothetical protein
VLRRALGSVCEEQSSISPRLELVALMSLELVDK